MKKGRWTPIAIFALVMLAVGYGLWYGSQVYIPGLNAEKAEIIRAEQEAEAAKLAAAESTDAADAVPYDYSIPIDEEALRQQKAAEAYNPDDAVSVTTDANGDVWITRDWSNGEGLNITDPPDPNENTGGATANIAGDAGSIPTDNNGVYYETFPEALGTTPGTTNPNGGNGGGNGNGSDGGNGGSTAAPDSNPTNNDAGGASGNGGTGGGGAPNSSGTPNGGSGTGTSTPDSNGGGGNGGSNGGGNGNGSGNNGGGNGTSNGGSSSGAGGGSSSGSPSGGGGSSGSGSSGSPKSGDVKYVDGQKYVYNSIFGWMLSGDAHSYGIQDTGGWSELGERVENASF